MVCASPRSICPPDEPAAPNARRQNCNRADAVLELLRIRSSANSRYSGLGMSSNTSSPLTMALTGLMRSWQPREHNSAASSRASGAEPEDELPDIRYSQKSAPRGCGESRKLAGLIHCECACCQHKPTQVPAGPAWTGPTERACSAVKRVDKARLRKRPVNE